MTKLLFLFLMLSTACQSGAQSYDCQLKPPSYTIHFGTGNVRDLNSTSLSNYRRVSFSCPGDGYYSYAAATSDCFMGDWHTIMEDHTPGDIAGNMMLVNASYTPGPFLITSVFNLKSNTQYEIAAWLMNLCRISEKCPYPLLPNITMKLQVPSGKVIAQFNTGDLQRLNAPKWTHYGAVFTTPQSFSSLTLTLIDNNPGGCGNDFALDDITFRECVKKQTELTFSKVRKEKPVKPKPITQKTSTVRTKINAVPVTTEKQNTINVIPPPVIKQKLPDFPAPPSVLTQRSNPLIKQIETEAGEIRLDVYDNGIVDGDTVSIYHNNILIVSHRRISEKPITVTIPVNAEHPHHELVMVAENLGSIPPNTSLMIVTAGDKRYEVFISTDEQKNAKVVIDLKQ